MLACYHMIEWVRIIVLAVIVIIGANLMIAYQVLSLNAIFGVVAFIIAHASRFSSQGQDCVDAQPGRARFLLGDIIFFWITFWF